jgi:hypothetical protein
MWDSWHAAHDNVLSHATNSVQVAASLGTFAGAGSIMYEAVLGVGGLAMKVLSTIVVAAVATATGFFLSRYLNRRFPPITPTPPVQLPKKEGTE